MLSFKFQNDTPLKILCLGAHCDDIEIGAGGTLLKIIQENEVSHLSWIVFASNKIRKQEALISAHRFVEDIPNNKVSINTFRDGFLKTEFVKIKEYFEELKKDIDPDLIFTHYRKDRHQDHRLISDLTWNTWRNHMILEYEIPKYDGDLGIPNFYVPLQEEIIHKRNKIILESFISQQNKHWFDEATFNALPRLRGIESTSRFAEAFYVRKLVI
ncbi:N-acetylglucosaminyl deacetylase, LmbE family [Draconibacterium orientale]|uniref:GlcNAc-PI de-N-acetylase n=1 Tax=Draconibacterium orientale TaxID=1168034 RepID=X5E2X5_9BACT|nr:PIG-L deacetylase family protein [Draconibacterium orientale]AHW60971.1 GlcNAc-PI de-N-acetylase [Draconibacterium orientale]SET86790.1 N-acetylglucosaminyl deacetylase, LmbE family [Draconibacterium orientale]